MLDSDDREDTGGSGQPVCWHLPGLHGQVGMAGGLPPCTEHLGRLPHLHHDDLQLYS